MKPNDSARPLIGCSAKLEEVRDEIARTAPTNATVMIRGEPGTGKDLVAHEIHLKSARADGPLIKVNGGALPDDLIGSELFGCEKGTAHSRAPCSAKANSNWPIKKRFFPTRSASSV